MPRHNSKGTKKPFGPNGKRNSIDVYKFIDENPTPATLRRRAIRQEVSEEETTERSPRKRTRMGGSE